MTIPYDLATLEHSLLDLGWSVRAQDYVAENEMPGRVDQGGYTITLVSPDGMEHHGDGPTRPEALRLAATAAGVMPDDCPPLH